MSKLLLIDDEVDVQYSFRRIFDSPEVELNTASSGEEGLKPTEALSGGEAARLLFCRLMMQKPNFLIFDEPTNHLDLEAINALNQALQKYEGTVLLVTHDQDLIDEVATRIWNFEDHNIRDFKGPYAEFLQGRTALSR